MSRPRSGSQIGRVVVSRDEARRLDAFVMRAATQQAAATRLGVALTTLQSGMQQGGMLASTRDRMLAALDREEAQ